MEGEKNECLLYDNGGRDIFYGATLLKAYLQNMDCYLLAIYLLFNRENDCHDIGGVAIK